MPGNFEHRVHTGYDKREGKFTGLPLQWASIVGNNQILKSTNRPLPLVDPSEITPTEILDLKTIVRPQSSLGEMYVHHKPGGITLPKTSHVARSNSLRSSSPPRVRRDLRGNANVPPSVPEEPIQQYPSMRRDGTLPPQQKMPPPVAPKNWGTQPPNQIGGHHQMGQFQHQKQHLQPNIMGPGQTVTDHGQPMYQNGNLMLHQPLNVHTDTPTNYYNNNNNGR